MDAEQMEVAEALRLAGDRFEQGVRARDALLLVEDYYAEAAQLVPHEGAPVAGRDGIVEFWKGLFGGGLRNAFLEISHVGVSGEIAYEIGQYTLVNGGRSGEEIHSRGHYLAVHQRQGNGTWKVVAGMLRSEPKMP
jgi:ketosteroid isomerase-like protein